MKLPALFVHQHVRKCLRGARDALKGCLAMATIKQNGKDNNDNNNGNRGFRHQKFSLYILMLKFNNTFNNTRH